MDTREGDHCKLFEIYSSRKDKKRRKKKIERNRNKTYFMTNKFIVSFITYSF